jgi:hypothetical protein
MTAALEGGEWSAARPGHTLLPGKNRYPFYRRLGGPQGQSGWAENLVPTGIWSQTVQPVGSRYTDWATWLITGRVVKQKKWVKSATEHRRGLDCSILLTNTQSLDKKSWKLMPYLQIPCLFVPFISWNKNNDTVYLVYSNNGIHSCVIWKYS